MVILGGSQGAAGLNRFVAGHVDGWLRAGIEVLHQVGPGRLAEAADPVEGYQAVEYLHDVPTALEAATLVLCRGGASTLAEIAAMRVPAWVVPYPHHADRHQERNARELGEGVCIVPEEQLSPAFAQQLVGLAGPDGGARRGEMSLALGQLAPERAAERLAEGLASLLPLPVTA